MTDDRESTLTELLNGWKILRDVLGKQGINVVALICAFGLILIATYCFWQAMMFWSLSVANEAVDKLARSFALEMLYTSDVAAVLGLLCLFFSVRERILTKFFPNRSR